MKVGAQLYTLHEQTKTLAAFSESLKRVADIGYRTVQVSGTCAYEPEWLAEQLKANGLTCDLTHFSYERIIGDTEKVVAEHNVYGCKYIGVGGMPRGKGSDIADFDAFVDEALPAAKKIAALGSYFMYHNHYLEYRVYEGESFMTRLAEAFPPEYMGFTLDTYWAAYAGADPVAECRRLAGRIPCVHFKDMVVMPNGEKRFAPIGSGILDFKAIAQACADGGTKYAFVEQDDSYGEDPFECLRKSYVYLRSIGLEQ